MRFMIIRRADAATETGCLPPPQVVKAIARYHDELRRAGVLVGGDALRPGAQGARIKTVAGGPRVVNGPFAETKELIAGFLLLEVPSKEEAIRWASRCPTLVDDAEIEVRQVVEAADFPPGLEADLAKFGWTTVSAQAQAKLGAKR